MAMSKFSTYCKKKRETEHKDEQTFPKKSKKSLSEVTYSKIMTCFMPQDQPYRKDSMKQIPYEQSLCKLTAEALNSLPLCVIPTY